eukprot:1143503-Pelagomonas_calceolata.AAC.2
MQLDLACVAFSLLLLKILGVVNEQEGPKLQTLLQVPEKERKEKEKKTTYAEETLPASIKENETHWLKRAVSPPTKLQDRKC